MRIDQLNGYDEELVDLDGMSFTAVGSPRMINYICPSVIVNKCGIVALRNLALCETPPFVASEQSHADTLIIVENVFIVKSRISQSINILSVGRL